MNRTKIITADMTVDDLFVPGGHPDATVCTDRKFQMASVDISRIRATILDV
jgi:hypothetical protein